MQRVGIIALVAWIASAAAAEACAVRRFHFAFGADTAATMLASSGELCWLRVQAGQDSIFQSVRIVAKAAHGSVTRTGSATVNYRSYPGYRGPDAFAFTVTGKGPTSAGPSTIRVSVAVE